MASLGSFQGTRSACKYRAGNLRNSNGKRRELGPATGDEARMRRMSMLTSICRWENKCGTTGRESFVQVATSTMTGTVLALGDSRSHERTLQRRPCIRDVLQVSMVVPARINLKVY